MGSVTPKSAKDFLSRSSPLPVMSGVASCSAGACGLDVAEADDACGVFDGRGRGGFRRGSLGLGDGIVVVGGLDGLGARGGHDLPCLPGFSGVGVGADRALSGAGMFVRAYV